MDDDCLRLVLRYLCGLHVQRNVRTLHAKLGLGEQNDEDEMVVKELDTTLVTFDGIVGQKETFLLPETVHHCVHDRGFRVISTSQLENARPEATGYQLGFLDSCGDECGEYDSECSEDDQEGRPYTCLGWARKKRVTYSIRLSRAICESVTFDVLVVPTSWWGTCYEGEWWVVQIVDAKKPVPAELNLDTCGYEVMAGYDVVGKSF